MAQIYVIIYLEDDPDDKPHWALYTIDDNANQLIFEAFGSSGNVFRYHCRPVNMGTSQSAKEKISIGRIEADVWPEIPDLFEGVPMSTQTGWNCQNWVMEAIQALKDRNFLEEDDRGLTYVEGKFQKKIRTYG